MAVFMSGRQRTFIRDVDVSDGGDWPWPALAICDDTRVYVAIDQKATARHGVYSKRLLVGFAAIWASIFTVVIATSLPTEWRPSTFMLIKLAVGVPLGFLALLFVLSKVKPKFMELPTVPHTAADLPLFFIDAEKGYAGDFDNCFAIQEIESIGTRVAVDTRYEHKCIAVKLRDGATHLYAPVHSDWFSVSKVAQQAEEIRRRFVPPDTPLPRPTDAEFEMPRMGT